MLSRLLCGSIFQQILAEAFGEKVELDSETPSGRYAELKAWAESTPVPEQKQQLRELYRNAVAGPLSSPAPS